MERLRRIAKPLFWTALIFAYVAAILPQAEAPRIASSDKVEHMIAFFTLAVLARLGYRSVATLRIALMLATFGAVIEFTQLIPMLHRDGEIADWLADVAALTVALVLVNLLTLAARPRRGAA